MTFGQSISTCFGKYATFSGRASRSEYWWWYLFNVFGQNSIFTILCSLILLLPGISVGVRRCHDTNHSGWWLLCPIYNLVLMLLPSEDSSNEYGALEE